MAAITPPSFPLPTGMKRIVFLPASCNERAHGTPMFAIPTPDVCRSLQVVQPQHLYVGNP
jgi:hypothetical protein